MARENKAVAMPVNLIGCLVNSQLLPQSVFLRLAGPKTVESPRKIKAKIVDKAVFSFTYEESNNDIASWYMTERERKAWSLNPERLNRFCFDFSCLPSLTYFHLII